MVQCTVPYPGVVLAILECAKGVSKGEITTALVSMLLDLVDTNLVMDPVNGKWWNTNPIISKVVKLYHDMMSTLSIFGF